MNVYLFITVSGEHHYVVAKDFPSAFETLKAKRPAPASSVSVVQCLNAESKLPVLGVP